VAAFNTLGVRLLSGIFGTRRNISGPVRVTDLVEASKDAQQVF